MQGAHNTLLDLEELGEEDLERLRTVYEELARQARTQGSPAMLDTGTPETGPKGLAQALSRLVLFDQHGQVVWSKPLDVQQREPPS
jgi:hypothetical protein